MLYRIPEKAHGEVATVRAFLAVGPFCGIYKPTAN